MKTQEEIEQLLTDVYGSSISTIGKELFVKGYTQCQQDIVELLRVEIHRAFIHGQGNAQMMEAGLERDEVEEYVNWRMLSLNKQD
jgi:hypothetical protein